MVKSIFEKFEISSEKIFIGGNWEKSDSPDVVELKNPKDESSLIAVAAGTEADVDRAVAAARKAQVAWQAVSAIERGNVLLRLADLVERHGEDFALIAAREHGKTIKTGRLEVGAAAATLRFHGHAARHITGEIHHLEAPHEQLWTQKVPFGVVGGLAPWNFPLAIAVRKIAPALLAGNAIVLKPHEITPLATLVLAELAKRAGVPAGVLNVVLGQGRAVGSRIVTHPDVRMVSMTGSTRAGKEIYAAAAPDLKVVRLELGGKAPFIVLEDADVDRAVEAALASKFFAGGQICTGNERMYVHGKVYDQFMEKFLRGVSRLSVGDPETDVSIGPWVSRAEVDKLDRIAREARQDGAVQLNPETPPRPIHEKGLWTFPRVFELKDHSARLLKEETFGPVVAALKIGDFEEALTHANDTEYGLTAFVWTDSNRTIMRAVQDLEFGEIYFNRGNGESVHGFHTGFKHSGLGGEDGMHGIDGYLRKKSVYNNYG